MVNGLLSILQNTTLWLTVTSIWFIFKLSKSFAPGLATDENGPNAKRSYQHVGGAWSPAPAEEGNYMIRARVSYEVHAPVITSPGQDLVTNANRCYD